MTLLSPHRPPRPSSKAHGNPCAWIFFLLFLFPFCLFANSITKIVDNGPDSNRVVFVIVGDGYREQDQHIFNADADSIAAAFKRTQPYSTYWKFTNWYRLNVFSVDSGIGFPNEGVLRNTPFGVGLRTGSYKIVTHNASVKDTVAKYLSKSHVRILVGNHYERGGAGGIGAGECVILREDILNTALHETGHCFGGLADEYSFSANSPPDVANEPNAALPPDTTRQTVKWRLWLEPGIPIPTDATPAYYRKVGVFDGCKYAKGCYRPEFDCMMRVGGPFCRICTEAITLKILSLVDPLVPSPATGNVTYNTSPIPFTVPSIDTQSIHYQIQWFLDGSPVSSNSLTYTAQPFLLGKESHVLVAKLTDTTRYDYQRSNNFFVENTRYVRNDPDNLTQYTFQWNLSYGTQDIIIAVHPYTRQPLFVSRIVGRIVHLDGNQGSLRIYDLRGRLLQSFHSANATTRWHAPAAGAYFIRLDGPHTNRTKRILIR